MQPECLRETKFPNWQHQYWSCFAVLSSLSVLQHPDILSQLRWVMRNKYMAFYGLLPLVNFPTHTETISLIINDSCMSNQQQFKQLQAWTFFVLKRSHFQSNNLFKMRKFHYLLYHLSLKLTPQLLGKDKTDKHSHKPGSKIVKAATAESLMQ